MSRLRAWKPEPGALAVVLAILAVLAAIVLAPPVPADTAVGPTHPGTTTAPDTMLDALEYRVQQLEERVEELEAGR